MDANDGSLGVFCCLLVVCVPGLKGSENECPVLWTQTTTQPIPRPHKEQSTKERSAEEGTKYRVSLQDFDFGSTSSLPTLLQDQGPTTTVEQRKGNTKWILFLDYTTLHLLDLSYNWIIGVFYYSFSSSWRFTWRTAKKRQMNPRNQSFRSFTMHQLSPVSSSLSSSFWHLVHSRSFAIDRAQRDERVRKDMRYEERQLRPEHTTRSLRSLLWAKTRQRDANDGSWGALQVSGEEGRNAQKLKKP